MDSSVSRRRLLKTAAAAGVGLAAWHAPELQLYDLRGARALAAASGPVVGSATATSFPRISGGKTFQHWGNGVGSTTWPVVFGTGDIDIVVSRRATASNNGGTNANGIWSLVINTFPTGCTGCEVTAITLTCPDGTTASTSGVPGAGGNLRCDNSPPDEPTNVTATFTITCT